MQGVFRRPFATFGDRRRGKLLALPEPHRQGAVELVDGRRLAYAEWGMAQGFPVLHMHGMPGSRFELHADEEFYRRMGVRLITMDRPGYGGSDRKPGRGLLDWPDDVSALADGLGLGRFSITAQSGGGPFALACAYAMPERIIRVAVAGCLGPLDRPGATRRMKLMNRTGLALAAHAPWLLASVYAGLRVVLDKSPGFFLDWVTNGKPASDRGLLADPTIHAQLETMLLEAVRRGVLGAVEEVAILTRPWGFEPSEVGVPVALWHGDQDDTAPLAHGLVLSHEIPDCELQICRGESHMVMWTHLAEMVRFATGAPYALAAS
jgi:pimeloyl-ACP methyl ester carboxylesterase